MKRYPLSPNEATCPRCWSIVDKRDLIGTGMCYKCRIRLQTNERQAKNDRFLQAMFHPYIVLHTRPVSLWDE